MAHHNGRYGATNSPHNQQEIDETCKVQTTIATEARQHIIAKGGFDGANCFRSANKLPTPGDQPAECASKLLAASAWASNHSNYNAVIAYGGVTGYTEYNDTTAEAHVAAFMLMRGEHWYLAIAAHNPCNPKHYPVTGRCHTDGCGLPCKPDSNTMNASTAALMVTDYGKPLGGAEAVPGKVHVYQRKYEKATVVLDCTTFTGSFVQ